MTNSELSKAVQQVLWTAWADSDEGLATAAADALIARGMAVPEGGAPELARLRLLMNAQPAELTEAQVEALVDAGNGALNDYYHERACSCGEYPSGCATDPGYARERGFWDTDAFAVGAPAVIALWEVMRSDGLARLRAEVGAPVEAVDPLETALRSAFDQGEPCDAEGNPIAPGGGR